MTWIMTFSGLAILLGGGELFVKGSILLAHHWRVSPLLIGLTIVSLGTSAPELAASLLAGLSDRPGIAMGNVVGSNIMNALCVLGLSALISPIRCSVAAIYRDGVVMLGASLALLVLTFSGGITAWQGVALVAALLGYLAFSFKSERRQALQEDDVGSGKATPSHKIGGSLTKGVIMTVIGLPVLVLGARLLVDGSVAIAHRLEIPETVIGLTVVAVGTSLPELVTSAIAAFRGQADLAVGNVLGSNIFNILGILGITATIVPLPPDEQIQALDIWVMAGSAALLVVLLFTGQKLSRLEGAALLGGYGIYLFALL